ALAPLGFALDLAIGEVVELLLARVAQAVGRRRVRTLAVLDPALELRAALVDPVVAAAGALARDGEVFEVRELRLAAAAHAGGRRRRPGVARLELLRARPQPRAVAAVGAAGQRLIGEALELARALVAHPLGRAVVGRLRLHLLPLGVGPRARAALDLARPSLVGECLVRLMARVAHARRRIDLVLGRRARLELRAPRPRPRARAALDAARDLPIGDVLRLGAARLAHAARRRRIAGAAVLEDRLELCEARPRKRTRAARRLARDLAILERL